MPSGASGGAAAAHHARWVCDFPRQHGGRAMGTVGQVRHEIGAAAAGPRTRCPCTFSQDRRYSASACWRALGKIYSEVKSRPRFLIERTVCRSPKWTLPGAEYSHASRWPARRSYHVARPRWTQGRDFLRLPSKWPADSARAGPGGPLDRAAGRCTRTAIHEDGQADAAS